MDSQRVQRLTGRESKAKLEARARLNWDLVLGRVQRGDDPTSAELAEVVKRFGPYMPPEAAEYVATRLTEGVARTGRPPMHALDLLRLHRETTELYADVQRLAHDYVKVRAAKPYSIDLPNATPVTHACTSRRVLEECTECGSIRILLSKTGVPEGWQRTRDSRWKIRQPQELAMRHVAIANGIAFNSLRSRLLEWTKHRAKNCTCGTCILARLVSEIAHDRASLENSAEHQK